MTPQGTGPGAATAAGLHFPQAVPRLAGRSLVLREICERDIPAWFERATDAGSADLAGDPVPDSIEAGAAWLQRHRDRFREQTALRWAIVPDGSDGSVGTVGLTLVRPEHRVAELGIVVGRAHWGRGIGSSAVALVAGYAFGSLGLAEIRADVLQRNPASLRLLEKTGFRLLRGVAAGAQADRDACLLYALPNPSAHAA